MEKKKKKPLSSINNPLNIYIYISVIFIRATLVFWKNRND